MKTIVFPGQGSQRRGMGKDLFGDFEKLTAKADKILGFSIKNLCIDDPEGMLNKTQFTQPALYIVNAFAYFKWIESTGQIPDYVAGHSLGEFNALLAAEAFSFESGLKLVKKRAELMGQVTGGGMAAVLNASKEEIVSILRDNGLMGIDMANFNTATQIVISGTKEEIVEAGPLFQKGAMEYYPLNTSGAFHSRYMAGAGKEFEAYLKKFKFSKLKISVISNVSSEPYKNGSISSNLSAQLTHPVKWHESIRYLTALGNMEFKENGETNVLLKMIDRIRSEPIPESSDGTKDLRFPALEETHEELVKKDIEVVNEQNAKMEPESSIENKLSLHVSNRDEKGRDLTDREIEGDEVRILKKPELGEESNSLTAEQKVSLWNKNQPIGTKVKSKVVNKDDLETRTEAVVLFSHRAAVYLEGYNGYFDLDELSVFSE